MGNAVAVIDVGKSYGDIEVIRGVSFTVRIGEIFALLGANGAGKTTILECIEGIRSYERGVIEHRGRIGVQLQTSSIMPECKVKEAVRLFALWNRATEFPTLSMFSLDNVADKPYGTLSTGQKKKLHLILALIGDPDIVILDEPTAGLDVEGRLQLHGEIKKLKQAGKTIILASHDMAEVEELCDRIAILREGRIAFIGTPENLKHMVGQASVLSLKISEDISSAPFKHCEFIGEKQGYQRFKTEDLRLALLEVLACGQSTAIEVFDIQTEHASLEQRFMEVSKEGLI